MPEKWVVKLGTRSVPPRGSGRVGPIALKHLQDLHDDQRPTRYRVVVLTSCKTDLRVLRQRRG